MPMSCHLLKAGLPNQRMKLSCRGGPPVSSVAGPTTTTAHLSRDQQPKFWSKTTNSWQRRTKKRAGATDVGSPGLRLSRMDYLFRSKLPMLSPF
jgi:hypothetical protein